jgi:hypothetical protein
MGPGTARNRSANLTGLYFVYELDFCTSLPPTILPCLMMVALCLNASLKRRNSRNRNIKVLLLNGQKLTAASALTSAWATFPRWLYQFRTARKTFKSKLLILETI